MSPGSYTPSRRTFLRVTGATAVGVSLAGCSRLQAFRSDDGLVLPPPENHDRIANADIPHPIYGEELPDVTIPAPLNGRSVTTTEFVGERHVMMTFVFTSCTGVCIGLTSALRHVQHDALERGYEDDVAFLPTTFDPEYDTPAVLEDYGEKHGADYDAGNWYFLRPETPEDAKTVVEDTFGVAFERTTQSRESDGGDESAGRAENDHEAADHDHDHDHEHERHFVHSSLILLVNKDGFVERAYTGGSPGPNVVIDDARAVVEGW